MMTARQFAPGIESIRPATSWYLAGLGEARGKQELFTRQSPQTLRVMSFEPVEERRDRPLRSRGTSRP
jgi:hypothetical protein